MTNKILICLLIIGTILPMMVHAQDQEVLPRSKHRVSAELGSYLFVNSLTLNYEPTLFESDAQNFRINGRMGLGLGFVLGFDGNHGISGVLGGVTLDFGKRNNHFLLSTGMILSDNFNEIDDISVQFDRLGTAPLMEMGWRFEKPTGGVTYKIAGGTLGLSVGIGYAF
ncbi:MAG: hypothetical protein R8G66_32435 [Cytophagales bacterium]|nr:hypothetical protein [Cytophagales bacterium]